MQLPDYINKMLDEIASDQGFRKYKLLTESGSNHGDNIHGVMVAIKLIGVREHVDHNANNELLHLMCKMAPVRKECRDSFQSALLFKREIYLYTRVLPAFVEFQREKELSDGDSFLAFPKIYATHVDDVNENYAIIMEDLRSRNFILWPRNNPMPLVHEKLVLEKLAKLHGVSLALKDQRPHIFNEFKDMHDVAETQIECGNFGNVIESALEQAINVLECDEHKKILQKCKLNYRRILTECFATETIERFGVINHGDCWINNYLFQYADDTNEVKNICLIDWQLSRYSSPAPDVLYQIFSSTRKQLRDQCYADLIHFYYTVCNDTITKLGSDPDILFRFTDLENELRASGKFILVMGTLVVQYVLARTDDIRNIDEYCKQLINNINNNKNANANATPTLLKNICEVSDVRIAAINDLVGDVIALGYDYS